VNVYSHFLFKKSIRPGCYNAGFENYSIKKIAEKIARKFNAKIVIKKIKDIRSYRQNSDKLIKTGFQRLYSIDRAIDELHKYFVKEKFKDHDSFYTVKWMKKLNIK
jgi:nucleoside-diphosphate-sugar epimerase